MPPAIPSPDPRDLPLRERKKLRTRRSLAETALRLFTEQGYERTTLDELVDAVEVSKRTFFRNFRSKEDVALAAYSELWSTYLEEVRTCQFTGPVFDTLRDALFATLRKLDDDWDRRFLATQALEGAAPAVRASSLGYCADTQQQIVRQVGERLGPDGDGGISLRLVVDMAIAAWRCAALDWAAEGGPDGRRGLLRRLERVFAAVPGSLALSV